MTRDQQDQCAVVIHGAAASAAAIGAKLAQIPVSDAVILVPIQIAMTVALGRVFGVEKLTEATAKGFVLSMASMHVGRGVSQVLFGWMPVVGNVLNAGTAAGITEMMGWGIARRFARGDLPGQ